MVIFGRDGENTKTFLLFYDFIMLLVSSLSENSFDWFQFCVFIFVLLFLQLFFQIIVNYHENS